MRALALMAVAILLGACGSNQDANRASPSDSGRPTATATPTPTATSLRLLYRAWDGDKYFLVAANADGSNSVVLSGANFANPDLIRFVQSRSRRWTAWADGGDLRAAASDRLASATTLVASLKLLSVLAISEDGDSIAYETLTEKGPEVFSANLYVVRVHDRSVKLLRNFDGPFIACLGDSAFDASAKTLIAIGCGAGMAAGLLLLNASDGSIISEDDKFFAWPGQWAFAADLKTVWLRVDEATEGDIVRYDTATRTREVLYRSPVWRQSDGTAAPNLSGPVLSPDETSLIFSRYTQDRSQEVYTLPSAGGTATMIFKGGTYSTFGPWSPDGAYVAITVDSSTPTQRMRLVDPRTGAIIAVTTGPGFIAFLAWIVS